MTEFQEGVRASAVIIAVLMKRLGETSVTITRGEVADLRSVTVTTHCDHRTGGYTVEVEHPDSAIDAEFEVVDRRGDRHRVLGR